MGSFSFKVFFTHKRIASRSQYPSRPASLSKRSRQPRQRTFSVDLLFDRANRSSRKSYQRPSRSVSRDFRIIIQAFPETHEAAFATLRSRSGETKTICEIIAKKFVSLSLLFALI